MRDKRKFTDSGPQSGVSFSCGAPRGDGHLLEFYASALGYRASLQPAAPAGGTLVTQRTAGGDTTHRHHRQQQQQLPLVA